MNAMTSRAFLVTRRWRSRAIYARNYLLIFRLKLFNLFLVFLIFCLKTPDYLAAIRVPFFSAHKRPPDQPKATS